jgi:NAD(P)-dependent dehydrogenase (short-subunit alcohol dehydrogenase family)
VGDVKQIAIITGGASGIGLALGTALVNRGWHVVLDDIQDVKAKDEADRLTRAGPGTAVGAGVDVRDADPLIALVQDTHAQHGRLDLMANNAGIAVIGEPDELDLVHWDTIIDTNLRGVIHGSHAAYPLMKQQGFGTILNTASIAGLAPMLGPWGPYTTSKFAVVGFSLALRAAGADYGVQVNVLCPGIIDTAIWDTPMPEGLPMPASLVGAPSAREVMAKAGTNLYPADRLAEDTLRGIEKNKAILAIPGDSRRLWIMARVAPTFVIQQMTKRTENMRKQLATASA